MAETRNRMLRASQAGYNVTDVFFGLQFPVDGFCLQYVTIVESISI
jgi:hypothetical protein